MKNEREKEISEWREGYQRKNSELRERLSEKERIERDRWGKVKELVRGRNSRI